MDRTAIAREIQDAIPDVQAIYLFGSQARREARAGSDIDIAVLAPEKLDPERRWQLAQQLAARLRADVDLVDLRGASTVMRRQMLESADVVLDAAPYERELFEALALSAYARLHEERKHILADIRERGRVHG